MPRITIYARVSTTDQHPEIQLNAVRTYAEARSLDVAEVYVDPGVSGANSQRPALDRRSTQGAHSDSKLLEGARFTA